MLQPGDTAVFPVSYGHYVKNLSPTEPLIFLELFKASKFVDFSATQWCVARYPVVSRDANDRRLFQARSHAEAGRRRPPQGPSLCRRGLRQREADHRLVNESHGYYGRYLLFWILTTCFLLADCSQSITMILLTFYSYYVRNAMFCLPIYCNGCTMVYPGSAIMLAMPSLTLLALMYAVCQYFVVSTGQLSNRVWSIHVVGQYEPGT